MQLVNFGIEICNDQLTCICYTCFAFQLHGLHLFCLPVAQSSSIVILMRNNGERPNNFLFGGMILDLFLGSFQYFLTGTMKYWSKCKSIFVCAITIRAMGRYDILATYA